MNLVSNILFIYAFISISLIIGIPGLDSKNLIQNKLFLFISLFIFQLLLESTYKLKYGCTNVNIRHIMNNSLLTATSTVIGYSIFIDLLTMENTKDIILKYTDNKYTHSGLIALIIVCFIFWSKIISNLITGIKDECVN